MKKAKQISICGILTALSIVLLFLGTVVWVFQYFMPVITGLLMIILVNSVDKKSAWTVFVAVSILSLLFMPDKECCLTYIFFFGYYPIIKENIDKIKSKFLLWVVRLLVFNVAIVSSQLVCIYVFGIPFDDVFGAWGVALLLLFANLLFVVYEKLINIVTVLYLKKYKNKIDKLLK
jgi:hypothetical protein